MLRPNFLLNKEKNGYIRGTLHWKVPFKRSRRRFNRIYKELV